MAEVVDSIVAELIAKADGYVANFDKATAAHGRFRKSVTELQSQTFDLTKEGQRYKQGAGDIAAAEEQTTQRVTRARKARADAVIAQDEREVRSAKKAARERADAEIAEANRSARLREVAERAAARSRVVPSTSGVIGATVPRERTGQRSIPAALLNGGGAPLAEEAAVNHLMADRARLQAALAAATGLEKQALRDQIGELQLIDRLQRAGVSQAEIGLAVERQRAAVEARRATDMRRTPVRSGGLGGANEFALGASGGRFGYSFSPGAIGGIASAAALYGITSAIQSAVELGQTIRDTSAQVGLSTRDWQVYAQAAKDAGVSNDQLASAFGALQTNIGKAREGSEEQSKLFKALGIDIKNVASAGELLPTLIDRISSIADPAQRAAVEVALFGENGRKLDALLSGGNDRVNDLAASLERTGRVLSEDEIRNLDETSRKLGDVKEQLQVEFAHVVSDNAESIVKLANALGELASMVITFLGSNPANAIALIGGLAGAPFGAAGIAVGAGVGYFAGNQAQYMSDLNRNGRAVIGPGGKVTYFDKNGRQVAAPPPQRRATGRYTPRFTRDDEGNLIELPVDAPGPSAPASPTVQSGRVDLGALSRLRAPRGRRGPRGKSAEELAREAEAREQQFQDQLFSYQQDQLRAEAEATGDIAKRAEIEDRIAANELAHEQDRIDSRAKQNSLRKGVDDALERARAATLKEAAANAAAADTANRRRETAARLAEAETERAQVVIETLSDQIREQIGLARTAKERRELELRLLELDKERERTSLEGIIRSAPPGSEEAKRAQERLDTLGPRYDTREMGVRDQTRGPLSEYLSRLPRTAADIDEAFERAAVHGLQNLNDGLTDAVSKFLHLHGIAGEFLEDLIRIGIQRELLIPLANALFPTQSADAGTGGGGGLFGDLIAAAKGIFSSAGATPPIAGFAGGGTMVLGGRGGVDANLLSLNGRPVARVSKGEILSISPNNQRVSASAPQVTVLAPRHYDLSNSLIDRDTLAQMNEENRAYARQVAVISGQQAVAVAGRQAPAAVQRIQTLGTQS